MTRFKGIKVLGKEPNEIFIKDKEKDYYIHTEDEVVGLLNEQQATISKLEEENKQLKHYKLYEDNKRLQTIIADLKEENEQLRQQLQNIKK